MYKRLDILAIINCDNNANIYLFSHDTKTLLFIESAGISIRPLHFLHNPYTLIQMISQFFSSPILKVKIYKYYKQIFYTNIVLYRQKQVYEFPLNIYDSVLLAKYLKIPIVVEEDILNTVGIKISKELITTALK